LPAVARTHYETLGVRSAASSEQIRKAYYDKARQLHPDGFADQPDAEAASRRAMQDVNEAWRVLREPASRATYDRALRQRSAPAERPRAVQVATRDLDRPYPRRAAEPGDLTVALVRAAPWVVVLAVLAAIVVFTAYARGGDESHDLVGKCINVTSGMPEEAPCDEPNDGRVVNIVKKQNLCTSGTTARVVAGGQWYCMRPPETP
jgi:molecular chaperone DnaJ